jgi:hypothetical protein
MMVAPLVANVLKSADGPVPNNDLSVLNMFFLIDWCKVHGFEWNAL